MGCSTSRPSDETEQLSKPAESPAQDSLKAEQGGHGHASVGQPGCEVATPDQSQRHVKVSETKQVKAPAEKAKYRLTKQIEKGSHSRIFEAYDRVTNERYHLLESIYKI